METKNDQSDRSNIGIIPASAESSKNLEVRQTSAIAEVSPISTEIETVRTFSSAGIRPIGVSHLNVVRTVNVMGIRPIGANTIDIVGTINQSGIRPIGSSHLAISETHSVLGNRPVAANTVNDFDNVLGFLD